MVKKLKELAAEAGDAGMGNLAQTVRESAQQIWLAGLGAFGKAQQEGGKVFEALVQEGKTLESRTRKLAGSAMQGISSKVGLNTMAAATKASATWDTLEQVFQDRVARALGRLGVPTNKDLGALMDRIEKLEKGSTGARVTRVTRVTSVTGVTEAAGRRTPVASAASVKKTAKRAAKRSA